MTEAEIQIQIVAAMNNLSVANQMLVLHYAQSLKNQYNGVPGRNLIHLSGTLPDEDYREIVAAIEEDCEKVDPNDW